MPCSHTHTDARPCQFNCLDNELITFDDQQWCPFHLPLPAKQQWTDKQAIRFNSRVLAVIAEATTDVGLRGVVFVGDINFRGVEFGEGDVDFSYTQFGEWAVSFHNAQFGEGAVSFNNAQFGEGEVSFSYAQFGEGKVSFSYAQFGEGDVSFHNAQFGEGVVDFHNAQFGEGVVDFRQTQFGEGDVSFYNVQFGDGTVSFDNAQFGDGEINFSRADLSQVTRIHGSLPNPILEKTRFLSRTTLRHLTGLSETQLQSAIFQDEIDFNQSQKSKSHTESLTPMLRITLEGNFSLSPLHHARLLLHIQTTYNALFYLLTTDDSKDSINQALVGNQSLTLIGVKDDIRIRSIEMGSFIVDIVPAIELLRDASKQPITQALTTFSICAAVLTGGATAYGNALDSLAKTEKTQAETQLLESENKLKALEIKNKALDYEIRLQKEKNKAERMLVPADNNTSNLYHFMVKQEHELAPMIASVLDEAGITFSNQTVQENQYEYLVKASALFISTSHYLSDLGVTGYTFEMMDV